MSDLLGPTQVVLIITSADIEQFGKKTTKEDIEAVSWHMPVSKEEMLYAISVPNSRFISKLIKTSGIFVVNFMHFHMKDKVHECSITHGEHIDKFRKIGFELKEAEGMECPVIKDACAY